MLLLSLVALPSLSMANPGHREPTLELHDLAFSCEDNFTRSGKGLCTQELSGSVYYLPPSVSEVTLTCDVVWPYTSQNNPGITKLKEFQVSRVVPVQNGFGTLRETLTANFGSVANETQSVQPARTNCHVSWRG
jgi:hypothetical protein